MSEGANGRRFDSATRAETPDGKFRPLRPKAGAVLGKRPPLRWGEEPPAVDHQRFSPKNELRPTVATGLRYENNPSLPTYYGSRRMKSPVITPAAALLEPDLLKPLLLVIDKVEVVRSTPAPWNLTPAYFQGKK